MSKRYILSEAEISELLDELMRRMADQGISGSLRLVGGAAVMFTLGGRDATSDVDALIWPATEVIQIARAMADEYELLEDWLNDDVKGFVPFVDGSQWVLLKSVGGAELWVASTEMLLAMKLRANRGTRDSTDIESLLSVLEIKTVEQAAEIYESYFHQEVLSDSAVARIEHWLDSTQRRT
ncbi:MAG: hypothetical protein RL441_1582 [Actinomycetota bacterium]